MNNRSNRGERKRGESREQGYVLLSLLLIVALLTIAAASAVSSLAFNIRRDREEEMIHRGVEYSRAIRRYTKKTGHYPLTLDALENTDGLRFLRKRYKDPITGKDFKLLHMTDLQRVGIGGLGPSAAILPNATNGNLANVALGTGATRANAICSANACAPTRVGLSGRRPEHLCEFCHAIGERSRYDSPTAQH